MAGMAVAEDVTLSVSGSADIEWGFEGQLIDNSGTFLGALATGDFYASDDAGDLVNMDVPAFTFTMSVEDADGNVIVEAAANEIALDDNGSTTFEWEEEFVSSLDYIMFPNVIPGILGITLEDDDALEPAYAPYGSSSSNERILIDVTPIPQLEATLGLLIKPDMPLYRTFYDSGVSPTGTFTWADDGDLSDLDDFDDFKTAALDDNPWQIGTFLSWALSLEATFTQELGSDGDEISVGIGTVIDSAFNNMSYKPDYGNDVNEMFSIFSPDVPLVNDAETQYIIDEVYGAQIVNPLSIEDEDHLTFFGGDPADDTMLRTNEVRGRTTIPVGLGITAGIGDLSASVDFQMALAEGLDEDNFTGIIDLTDLTKSTLNYATYAMPMYVAVDVGYEMAVGDMTITPGVNFKYSSDFWKWGFDFADDEEWEYMGDVSGADWIGRPMSLDAGIDVEGIAGMIDISVSASVALGDGPGNHGFGLLNDPLGAFGAVNPGGASFTLTHDAGVAETVVFDNTLAEMIDFYYVQPTLAADDANFWTAGTEEIADAADGENNNWFGKDASAMGIEVAITVMPIDGLTIANTTNYDIDNLGLAPDLDIATLFGYPLSTLTNETNITYDWMVGDAVAFTIFADLTYTSEGYFTEAGQSYIGLRTDADPAAINDVFEFGFSEAPSMATFDYALGVRCSVGL
jgi:hypothetical protein